MAKGKAEIISDAWENIITGLSTWRDKRTGGRVRHERVDRQEARDLYASDDMAARAVDRPAEDALREGFAVQVGREEDEQEAREQAGEAMRLMRTTLDELQVEAKFKQALQWQRAYGGAGVVMVTGDGLEAQAQPLPDVIDRVHALNVFQADELQVVEWQDNPWEAGFGEPKAYQLTPRSAGEGAHTYRVHASRVLRFCGPVPSREDASKNNGWGQSIFDRLRAQLRDFGLSWGSAAALVQDFSQTVHGIKGLADLVAADNTGAIKRRLELMDLARSTIRAVLIDTEGETFDRKATPVSGLPELLDRLSLRLAAAVDMPVAMLMGQAPAGLNATGSENTRYYYDRIASIQRYEIKPQLDRLVQVVFRSRSGPTRGTEPDVWQVEFSPLWQLDELQTAQARAALATADAAYVAAGVLTPEEVARARFGGEKFGWDVQLDHSSREGFAAADDDDLEPGDVEAIRAGEQEATPAAPEAGAPATPPVDAALAGGQITSAQGIVVSVAKGELPRGSGVAMLVHLLGLNPEAAEAVMGEVGKTFEAPKPQPPMLPPGAPPPPPANKPAPDANTEEPDDER